MSWIDGKITKQELMNAIVLLSDYCARQVGEGQGTCGPNCWFKGKCPFKGPLNMTAPMMWKIPETLKQWEEEE